MKTVNLGQNGSVFNTFLAEMRDASIQKDRMRFRNNLERVGEVFAYELSKVLAYSPKEVTTPLGIATVNTCDTPVVIATILRAGLPLQKGFLNFFDHAEASFLATFRKYGKGDYFELRVDYCSVPSLEGKALVIADTMIATGASIGVHRQTRRRGRHSRLHPPHHPYRQHLRRGPALRPLRRRRHPLGRCHR